MRSLTEDGHARIGVRATSTCTEIIIYATRPHDVLDEKGRRIRKLAPNVQRLREFPWNSVEHFNKSSEKRPHCAAQAESLRYNFSIDSLFIELATVSSDSP